MCPLAKSCWHQAGPAPQNGTRARQALLGALEHQRNTPLTRQVSSWSWLSSRCPAPGSGVESPSSGLSPLWSLEAAMWGRGDSSILLGQKVRGKVGAPEHRVMKSLLSVLHAELIKNMKELFFINPAPRKVLQPPFNSPYLVVN